MQMRFSTIKKLSAFAVGFSALLMLFHNCSRVNLKKLEVEISSLGDPIFLDAHICPQPFFGPNDSTKFVFIVDLSASNFGDWELRNGAYYFNPALGTDSSGQRFAAIRNFISNCGGTATGSQFAVVGFSRAAGTLMNNVLSCQTTAFVDAATATSDVNALAARQDLDYQNAYKQFETNPYQGTLQSNIVYANTSYSKANECLERVVANDLLDPNSRTDRYQVFFISDGIPADAMGQGCENTAQYPTQADKTKCYYDSSVQPLTMVRIAAASKGKELLMQGIYYGGSSTVPYVLDELSKEGGTRGGIAIGNFNNTNALCQLVTAPSAISYRPDVYVAMNMTSYFRGGQLIADSDMDGLSDVDEARLGYNAANPRSAVPGVLDGICEMVGGRATCQTRATTSGCNPTTFPGLGLLSDCDLAILDLRAGAPQGDVGVDYDRDGIPDFVEIVKGTDPKSVDQASDVDGDGRTAREELIAGTDPFTNETNYEPESLNNYKVDVTEDSPFAPTCGDGDWTLTAKKVVFSPTLSVQGQSSYINHAIDQQKLMIFYRSTPVNSVAPQLEYFVSFIDVSKNPATGILMSSRPRIGPADFVSLGKVRQ